MSPSIVKFATDSKLLNLQLYPKQAEILAQFWEGNYRLGIFNLGRRSGKSMLSAVIAVFSACLLADTYKSKLRQGERFYIVSIANTLPQSKIALQVVKDLITNSPILKKLVVRETSDSLELSNGAIFKALPASSRAGRGLACPLLIFDELAFSTDTEGNSSGSTIFQALSPSVAQFGDIGKILILSSPYTKSGIFYDLYTQASSGAHPQMLAVTAPTWEVNPTISKEFLAQEKARDPAMFEVEYGANFLNASDSFLPAELVERCVDSDRLPLPPDRKYRGSYFLALDPAKGNRDDYTACVVHYEDELLVIDLWHKFEPTDTSYSMGKKIIEIDTVESWILDHHRAYDFCAVVLDQYNSLSTIQRLQGYVPISELTWSSTSKTKAYSKLKELFNNQNIQLYPHHKAINQLKNLTVKYSSGGNWGVSGGSGTAVDDYCSALAGAVLAATPDASFDFLEALTRQEAHQNKYASTLTALWD